MGGEEGEREGSGRGERGSRERLRKSREGGRKEETMRESTTQECNAGKKLTTHVWASGMTAV